VAAFEDLNIIVAYDEAWKWILHRVWKKHLEHYWLSLEEGISSFNNF